MPFFASCVSAVDDTSAFGFAGASSSAPSDGDDTETVTASGADGAPDDAAKTAANGEASDASAPAGGASIADNDAGADESPASPSTLRDRMTKARPVAAYAGGSVTEGDAVAAEETAARPAQTSLFASLFAKEKARTPIANASKGKSRRVILRHDEQTASDGGLSDLPGVDPSSLFEIGQKASANEDAIDDVMSTYRVASLGGLARLSPNGLSIARDDVQTSCFPSDLVAQIRAIERRFGAKAVITSGYRSPTHNARVNGARRSQHMGCKAADLYVPGADSKAVAAYVRALPGRGGVGTYCHTQAIHIDVGPKRDWNWRCRRRK
ncbi:YcbK family protein [Jiella sp. KSK16Y-1]|uniref:YcbK family protein n=2 Tax=Jiella mangrovi TaxID=2821407 RepID=A0ABS4BMX7_9HYPH|nr:YcbK family protein [Jiella mangrovi]